MQEDRQFASSPCFAHELELGPNGYVIVDEDTRRTVARWRKAERERLVAIRLAVPTPERALRSEQIGQELDRLIPAGPDTIVSVYWPIRGEIDLRPWMKAAVERRLRVAMPVVSQRDGPLTFREWRPGARMERGIWNIPYPADGAEVTPTVVIAPLLGFDEECYRLGNGGGYFDRTLAALSPRPLVIGVGLPETGIRTIYPQPYDIPMDVIVTGAGEVLYRKQSDAAAGRERR
jgi:5-formyltetrahydrofolate cyclo-ligase